MNTPENEITIDEDECGTYFLIRIGGSLTAKHVLQIRKVLESSLNIGHTKIAIDLVNLQAIDSTGLGLLFNFSKNLTKQEGQLIIFNPKSHIQEIFALANAYKGLRIIGAPEEEFEKNFD